MTQQHDETGPKVGYIPKPPNKAELDQLSQDQALITDEWADGDGAEAPSGPALPGSIPGSIPGSVPG